MNTNNLSTNARAPQAQRTGWMRLLVMVTTAFAVVTLSGCAMLSRNTPAQSVDPFEPYNRAIFKFNDVVDNAAIKPVARAYNQVVPSPARSCISGVFSNFYEPVNIVNNLLQGKGKAFVNDVGRFTMNSFIGLGGCIDVASKYGVESSNEDFGQTLGRWGVGSGPYLVLPVFGPTTLRDLAARPADNKLFYLSDLDHVRTRNSITVLRAINVRSETLTLTNQLDALALDRYSFYRDSFLQRRKSLIFDGQVPDDEEALQKAQDPQKSDDETESAAKPKSAQTQEPSKPAESNTASRSADASRSSAAVPTKVARAVQH